MALFPFKEVDKVYYEKKLKDFLPDKIIDIHTHVHRKRISKSGTVKRVVTWPGRVAEENPVEDLMETYDLMFPGKKVTPFIFCTIRPPEYIEDMNTDIHDAAVKYHLPSLYFSRPEQSIEELAFKIKEGGFLGVKVYLSFSPSYLSVNEIRIFDFLPHEQLKMLNKLGLIVMLHIPRSGRLKDPVNIAQILEIEEKYPDIQLILAHVGRAYCREDVGDSLDILSKTKNLVFDFSANTNQWVFARLIEAMGPERILFGSDLPIARMRMRRICKNGIYMNLVPKGLYGDVSGDRNMGELEGEEAEALSFFMYEEINAFKKAAEETGLSRTDIENVFYNNSKRIIEKRGFKFL